MQTFEYIKSVIGFIFGLGLAKLLQSAIKLISYILRLFSQFPLPG